MDKSIRRFTSHEELRAETYRYWHARSDAEVFQAIAELSESTYRDYYRNNGITPNAEGSKRSLTRIQRAPR